MTELNKIEARQGDAKRINLHVLLLSTAIAAIAIAIVAYMMG